MAARLALHWRCQDVHGVLPQGRDQGTLPDCTWRMDRLQGRVRWAHNLRRRCATRLHEGPNDRLNVPHH